MTKEDWEHHGNGTPWKISLSRSADGGLFVVPATGDSIVTVPFPLPPLAYSNAAWLSGLANTFWMRRGRCLALWLILDCWKRRWMPPLIPRQQCSREGVAWHFDSQDFDDYPPQCRIGGSFQVSAKMNVSETIDMVPPLDGLHLVDGRTARGRGLMPFVHVDGTAVPVSPETVIADDWQAVIDEHWHRFDFE